MQAQADCAALQEQVRRLTEELAKAKSDAALSNEKKLAEAQGRLDSRLAGELGVFTLPTMLLIDQSGKVVRRNIHIGELEEEVRKLLK